MNRRHLPLIPLSICLIVKNERRNLRRFHESLRQILGHPKDEVVLVDTGSVDGTQELAHNLGYTVYEHPELCDMDLNELGEKWMPEHWAEFSKHAHFNGGVLRSFSEARQLSFNYAKNEHCLWLDLDDELVNPQVLRSYMDQVFSMGRPGGIFLRYDYAHDPEDGSCTTVLWRERLVTKSAFLWKGLCHETLTPKPGVEVVMARDPNLPCFVRHVAPKPHKFSDLRNYVILRNDFEVCDNQDPRTMFYLGNACRGLEENQEALDWYERFVTCSGSRDDIMAARLSMAACFSRVSRYWRALGEALEAQRINPADPRVYYTQANLWAKLEHWPNVLTCVQLGDQFQVPDTLHAVDPVGVGFQPAALALLACREMRRPDEAMQHANRVLQSRPGYKVAQEMFRDTQQWAGAEKGGQILAEMLRMARNPLDVLKNMVVSPHLAPRGLGTPEAAVPGAAPGKTSVAFWCGSSAEHWGPDSAQRGIGASEKMVVELAKRLAAKGMAVTVYNSLSCAEGEYDGVNWRQIGHFNPELYRDYVVVWRMPGVVAQVPFRAGKLYVWMHDVGCNAHWTPEVLAQVDKVFFLSEFQRSLHPNVPDEKVYLTRNGIDLERHLYKGETKQKKIIFCSSPDRGWKRAIRAFLRCGAAAQGYTLHMFYGFGKTWRTIAAQTEYGYIVEEEENRRMLEYEDECLEM